MNEAPNLTFNLRHITRETTCAEAGHSMPDDGECSALHTAFTGDATLTISGPADLVRRAGAAALPFFAAVLDGPSTPIAPTFRHPDVDPSHDPYVVTEGRTLAKCRHCRQVVVWGSTGNVSARGALECKGHPVKDEPSEMLDNSSDDV